MRGIVLNSKGEGREDRRYCIFETDSRIVSDFRSSIGIRTGDIVTAPDADGVIETAEIERNDSELQALNAHANDSAKALLSGHAYATGNGSIDAVTGKMWDRLLLCGSILMRKLIMAAPVIVRFHNDADGSGGAYGLYKSMHEVASRSREVHRHNISWIMQQNVSYSAYDAAADMAIAGAYSSLEKPLLVMIDFGTSPASNSGFDAVRERFDIIWLDHHPLIEGFRGSGIDSYVNPWSFGGDSNYTAGLLACVFSKTFSEADTSVIENASLVGDYSSYAIQSGPGADLSMLLDLVTSDPKVAFGPSTPNVTPREIDNLLMDQAKLESLMGFAKTRLAETTDAALKAMKRYKAGNSHIYMLDFEGLRDEQSKYPLPGRFSSKLLDRVSGMRKEPCIVIVHSGRYISIRVSRELSGKVDLAGVIGSLRESYAELIEAGGGHMLASGIKLADKVEKEKVLKEIVSLLRKQLSGEADSGAEADA